MAVNERKKEDREEAREEKGRYGEAGATGVRALGRSSADRRGIHALELMG